MRSPDRMSATCNGECSRDLKIAQARLAAPSIEQFAAAYMLEHIRDEYLEGVRNEFKSRRDALYCA